MIQTNDILIAGEGKTLYYPAENIVWGYMARLASYKGHMLTKEDFVDIDKSIVVNIDGSSYVFFNWKYKDIVEFIIKLHYTYDAQIALILNYQQFPEQYKEAYEIMQNWRAYAKEVATRFTDGSIPSPTKEQKEV